MEDNSNIEKSQHVHVNATPEFLANENGMAMLHEMVALAYNGTQKPSKKTAMQQLQDWVNTPTARDCEHKSIIEKINELIAVERQIIVDAHNDGIEDPESYGGATYYNEKFKNK